MELQGKEAFFLCLTSFSVGVFVGYKIKTARLQYLKWKRERLMDKLNTTTEQIHKETRG